MSIPESQLENLVARCLDAGETGYHAELARLGAAHPEVADELRQRIAKLEELGFLGDKRSRAGTHWLPDQVGGYRLSGLLGRGGMGVVFRGRKDGGDEVAIKIVRPDLLADERARERFRREALLAARLSHPGICPVLEVGIDDDVPYLVMPLLAGRTFGAWVREQRPERERMLEALEGHARALHAAHQAGLVHRDVTPGNLFVSDEGRAVVLDFGLARDTTGEVATLTLSQEQLGTLPYMAPEQIRGGRIDRRTDVYALGVVLYEALAGRLPFVARVRSDVSRLILSGDAPRLTKVTSGVSRPLERVVQTAMDLDPARRYATALEFAEDLARLRAWQPVSAHGVGPLLRARRWAGHHPVATTAILLLTVLLLVATAFVVELRATVRIQAATERALASRTLELADPVRSMREALAAHDGDPSPVTLGQLNRLLHQVHMLATHAVLSGPVRRLVVSRIDDATDRLAVASESGVMLLRIDRGSGAMREERPLPVPPGVRLGCVRFSPDGRHVAYGGTGKKAFVAAVPNGPVRELSGANGEVVDVEVDNEGGVIGADANGCVWHWPADGPDGVGGVLPLCNLKRESPFPGHDATIKGMRSGPGGDLLVWNFEYALRLRRDGTKVWWAPPTGEGRERPVVVLDRERDMVVLGQLGGLRTVRWSDGVTEWTPELSSPVIDVAVASGGTVASLHDDGTLRFWRGGQPITEYRDDNDYLGGVTGVRSGDCFLVTGRGGTLTRIDTNGRVERTMSGGDIERWGSPGVAWTSDSSVAVVSGGPGLVRSWDFDGSRAAPQARLVASAPIGLSLHPDGERLLVYTADGKVWNWRPGGRPAVLGHVPFAYLARNRARAGAPVVIGGRDGRKGGIAILDGDRAAFRTPFVCQPQYGIVGAAVVPGDRLLVAAADNRFLPSQLQLFATGGDRVPFQKAKVDGWEVPLATGIVTCMDASADGKRVVFGCVDGGLHVWELPLDGGPGGATRTVASKPTNGRVWSVDMSADGRLVVAGVQDGSVVTWRVDEEDPVFLVRPRGRAARASLTDGDRFVIEFAPDGLVCVWDLQCRPASKVLEVVAGDGAVVRDAVLMHAVAGAKAGADRRRLAAMRLVTVSLDGWLRQWSFDEQDVVSRARSRLATIEQR